MCEYHLYIRCKCLYPDSVCARGGGSIRSPGSGALTTCLANVLKSTSLQGLPANREGAFFELLKVEAAASMLGHCFLKLTYCEII